MTTPQTYLRILEADGGRGEIMVEVSPHRFVNLPAARAFGLISKTFADEIAEAA